MEFDISQFTDITPELEIAKDPTALFYSAILDQTKNYPPPPPLLYFFQNGERYPHRTKKSYSLQQGRQKSKKTTALAIEVAAYINPVQSNDPIRFECVEPGTVLFFDNEQGESYAARTMKLILSLAGLKTSESLIYCDLRIFTPQERRSIIKAGIEATPNVKWVIIDGIVDVMDDFMSAPEGQLVISDLLRLCSEYDIHITGVLHQNKSGGKDARAHVGSISSQKCEVEVMIEVDDQDRAQSIVSCKESRDLPFDDFAIRWDKGSLPCIVQDWHPTKKSASGKTEILLCTDIAKETHVEILQNVFKAESSKKYNNLLSSLQNQINSWYGYSISEAKVRNYIEFYLNEKLLDKTGKTPHTKYSLNAT
ncbi:MAG TPA: AAA family ATPase [Sphingobacteriaceae bacterium]|nr:AAA family ATPase [Sphingobacteriaceae bacterium]